MRWRLFWIHEPYQGCPLWRAEMEGTEQIIVDQWKVDKIFFIILCDRGYLPSLSKYKIKSYKIFKIKIEVNNPIFFMIS